MSLSSVQQYVAGLLNNLAWPAGMQALPSPPNPLQAEVTPIDPDVDAVSTPKAYIWMEKGRKSRDATKYKAGTVPRAAYKGAPSGTKEGQHAIPVYIVWHNTLTDPNADILFTGMIDAICDALEYSGDPVEVFDPWDNTPSWVVDVGETVEYETAVFTTAPQRLGRYVALLTVPVVEIYAG